MSEKEAESWMVQSRSIVEKCVCVCDDAPANLCAWYCTIVPISNAGTNPALLSLIWFFLILSPALWRLQLQRHRPPPAPVVTMPRDEIVVLSQEDDDHYNHQHPFPLLSVFPSLPLSVLILLTFPQENLTW